MTKEQIENIRELAKKHDFKGVPIPQLCDLAILGAITRDLWFAERFQPSAETYYEAREAFAIAEREFCKAEAKRQRSDFEKRWPGAL